MIYLFQRMKLKTTRTWWWANWNKHRKKRRSFNK